MVSHPIQYQAGLLRILDKQDWLDLRVLFESDFSTRDFFDEGFGRKIQWDVPLTEGYNHEFISVSAAEKVKRLAAERFDAVWFHGYSRPFNLKAIHHAKRAGMKVLIRDEANVTSRRRSIAVRLAKFAFFRVLDSYVDGYLTIGNLNRAYYRHHGIDSAKLFSMPYCVDNDHFMRRAEEAALRREKLRSELELTQGRPIILYASKLSERKRPDDLLAAFKTVLENWDSGLPPYLMFIGDGERLDALKSKAEQPGDNVRFLGFRGQQELPAYLDLADLMVLPSVHEPWGLIVNEAMCAGTAVLVSDAVGCAPDLVSDGVTGAIFPAGDEAALAATLNRLMRQPKRLAEMGANGKGLISGWSYAEDVKGLLAALTTLFPERMEAKVGAGITS